MRGKRIRTFPLVLALCGPTSRCVLHWYCTYFTRFRLSSEIDYTPQLFPYKIKSLHRCDRKGLNIRMPGWAKRSDSALVSPVKCQVFQIAEARGNEILRSRAQSDDRASLDRVSSRWINTKSVNIQARRNSAQFNPPILAAISLRNHHLLLG